MGKPKINLNSVVKKVEKASANKFKKNKNTFADVKGKDKAIEAAHEFIKTLKDVIEANPNITPDTGSILSNLDIDRITSKKDNTFTVGISFRDPYRHSLYPVRYGDVHIPKLINNGISHHPMNRLYGYWHDNFIGTRTDFYPTHFMSDAINMFMSTKAGKYDVKRITPHWLYQSRWIYEPHS